MEEIKEAFEKGGSPKSPEGVLQSMLGGGMQAMINSYFGWDSPETSAQQAMEKYVKKIKEESKTTKNKAIQEFLEVLKEEQDEKAFISALAKAAGNAYRKLEKNGKVEFEKLSEALGSELEESYLEECDDCDSEAISLVEKMPKSAPKSKKKRAK